ncbi:MAG TPA: 30S ribosomal protein S6 [Candidatus Limiplasma sp.]|nr:30S ribosomal protein S6 [Candidatus Limiplasma sp.]
MNRYELTYIINTALEETARKELIEKFTELIKQNGGEIEKVDETWGKRRLAYLIDDMQEGYYVLTTFSATGELNKEIQRNLENNDMIIRYLIIKLLDKKQSVKPRAVRPAPVPVPAPLKEEVQEKAEPAVEDAEAKPAAEVEAETAEQTE